MRRESFGSATSNKTTIGDYQWDLAKSKSRRTAYLFTFFLMIFVPGGILAVAPWFVAYIVSIAFGLLFMFLFLGLAKQLLSWSKATIVVGFIVIGFIPLASLLAIVIVDHQLFNVIKQREKLLKSATAPAPVPTTQTVQLKEEQIEQKLFSIRKSLEAGIETEFILPTTQGTAVCIGCNKVSSKQELFYCKEQDFYVHQNQKCFDKLNAKITVVS